MNIIFEVEDLLEASPATVSRCGMVYLESKGIFLIYYFLCKFVIKIDLGWEPLFDPWFCNLTENLKTYDHIDIFSNLLKVILKPMIDFVVSSGLCKTSVPCSDQWLASNCLRLFESFLYKKKTK